MPEGAEADLGALSDLCTPWCLHVVATLRIAERIAAGTTGIDQLAREADCHSEALERVIRHLVGKGVFLEPVAGEFALNDAASGLLDPGLKLGLDLDGIGGRMAHAWSTLPSVVKTGKPAYAGVFGRPFWEDLEAHPEVAASFDALIGPPGHGTPDPEVLIDRDWDSVRTVVDVGGGTGARPGIKGILVDLPRPVAGSAANFDSAGVADRVTTVGQSFFDPLPDGADLYILKSILNDWPDPEALAILRRCAEAVSPRGRIAVIGGVTSGDRTGGVSIEMVLLGGKERTVPEFQRLAGSAGLKVVKTGHQPSGRFVVECRLA